MGLLTFLWRDSTVDTGKKLADAVAQYVPVADTIDSSVAVVCWGVSRNTTLPCLNRYVDNNKWVQHIKLSSAGVPVPDIVPLDYGHMNMLPCDVVARRSVHYNGSGMRLIREGEWYIPGDGSFHVRFIPSVAEYRVHVFGGSVIAISERRGGGGWNRASWGLYRCDPLPRPAVEIALSAVHALNYDFGAVDLLRTCNPDDSCPEWVVLEVNSAPVLNAGTFAFKQYVEYIVRWAKNYVQK